MEKIKRNKNDRVLYIRDLNISFKTGYGTVRAIRGVRLDLFKGETIAIVGESGSGKSVTVKTIMGILDSNGVIDSGQIIYRYTDENGNIEEYDLVKMSQKEIRYKLCGKHIAMVFQDPMTSLNPVWTIGNQIEEAIKLHTDKKGKEAHDRARELLTLVGINEPEKRLKQYPHELSGGMRQRVMIAIALACEPKLLIADEPTTALDVTIQAQILELMQELKRKLGMGIIMITHDLGVVASMCDHIAVMYAGEIIEYGTTDDIFYNPQHEYTRGLLRSIPKFHEKDYSRLVPIEGQPVDLLNRPKGCCFAPRCSNCMKICLEQPPVRNEYETLGGAAVGENVHYGRCWLEQKYQILGRAEAVVTEEGLVGGAK